MISLNEQRNQRNRLESRDAILSLVISLFFIVLIIFSGAYHDVKQTPEAKRYEYDIHAKFGSPEKQEPFTYKGILIDNGTVRGGELSTLCGENWYTNFYKRVNRPHRLALLDTCQLSQEQQMQVRQAIAKKSAHLQKQISTKYTYFRELGKGKNIDGGGNEETIILGFAKIPVEKDYFKESLSLNDTGNSETLAQVPKLLKEAKESRELLALVAAMEGDTAFPYSEVYQGEASAKSTQLNAVASLVRKVVRINTEWADKAEKTRNIISLKGMFIFALLLGVAYVCLCTVRRQRQPWVSTSILLMIWGTVGFILVGLNLVDIAQSILWTMLVAGIVLLLVFLFIPFFQEWGKRNAVAFQMPATSWAYSFFVLCLWISIVILLELSVNGHIESRFFIYNHYRYCYWALVALTIAPTVANALSVILSKWFARLMIVVFWGKNIWKKWSAILLLALPVLGFIVVYKLGLITSNNTIEMLKVYFIFGLALVFTVKRFSLQSMFSKRWIMIWFGVSVFSIVGMLVASEMGTILVLLYSSLVIIGAYLSYFFLENKQGYYSYSNSIKATIISILFIIVFTSLLLVVSPEFSDRLYERKMSMINPFGSTNDQMAIIHWLRQSAPSILGYSLGDVPWCGFNLGCAVPKQMQSDYTATSIILLSGWILAFMFFLGYISWLMSLVKGHLTVESNKYDNQRNLGQIFLLWSGIIWVLITLAQMIVTVLGNLGLLPLTGVTFPFVSYGATSLILCSIFFGLLINRPLNQLFRQEGDI